MRLKNRKAFTVPMGLPSRLAPLSEMTISSVSSRTPTADRKSTSRPSWASACSSMAAKAACSRTARRRSSAESESHGATPGLRGGTVVPGWITPEASWRAMRSSRVTSQPFSNTGT